MVAVAINIEINNSTVLAQVKLINWKKYLQNSLSDLVSFHLIKMSSKSSHKRHSTINTFWIIHLRWRSNDCGIVSNSTIKHTRACARLTALCPWLPGWAGTRKVKPNLDFTEATHSEWQQHQLGHMQVCTSLQTDNHASTPSFSFLQARCPSCHPTNSVKELKAISALKQYQRISFTQVPQLLFSNYGKAVHSWRYRVQTMSELRVMVIIGL